MAGFRSGFVAIALLLGAACGEQRGEEAEGSAPPPPCAVELRDYVDAPDSPTVAGTWSLVCEAGVIGPSTITEVVEVRVDGVWSARSPTRFSASSLPDGVLSIRWTVARPPEGHAIRVCAIAWTVEGPGDWSGETRVCTQPSASS